MVTREMVLSESTIPHEWKRWVAENKMLGIEDQVLVEALIQNGIEEELALEEVSAIEADPYFQAGNWMAQKLRKIESLLDIHRNLSALSSRYGTVERRSDLTQTAFLEDYYTANRPVILRDLVSTWKALSVWTPQYLKDTCGNETVEIMTGRSNDSHYELNSEKHRSTILFKDYVDLVTNAGQTNDFYLVANNHFLEREGMKPLQEYLDILPQYLDYTRRTGAVFFWFGPAGTVTPLHHDTMNILLTQVYGRKRVILISPDQTHLIYNNIGVFSEVDCERPDYENYPAYREVHTIEVVLDPGEVLFLPVGWWHHVRALDASISVTFTNFRFPNDYQWHHPAIVRR